MRGAATSSARRLLAALILVFCSGAAAAHPHAWADIEVELVFAGDGSLTALRQAWVFDEAFTAYMLPPLRGRNARPETERHAAVARELTAMLREHGHFTRLDHGGGAVATPTPVAAAVTLRGRRMVFGFELPLAVPLDVRAAPLTYAVFDPTYFIEIVHAAGRGIRLVDAPPDCAVQLRKPQPDPQIVAKAAALDATQSGGDALGQEFAEKVSLRCGTPP